MIILHNSYCYFFLLKSKFGDKSKVRHPVAASSEQANSIVDVRTPSFLFVEKTESLIQNSKFDLTLNGNDYPQASESIPIIAAAGNVLETRASVSASNVENEDSTGISSNPTQLSEAGPEKNFAIPSRDGQSRVPIPTRTWNSLDQSALTNNNATVSSR